MYCAIAVFESASDASTNVGDSKPDLKRAPKLFTLAFTMTITELSLKIQRQCALDVNVSVNCFHSDEEPIFALEDR